MFLSLPACSAAVHGVLACNGGCPQAVLRVCPAFHCFNGLCLCCLAVEPTTQPCGLKLRLTRWLPQLSAKMLPKSGRVVVVAAVLGASSLLLREFCAGAAWVASFGQRIDRGEASLTRRRAVEDEVPDLETMRQRADSGDADSQAYLGAMYLGGEGVAPDQNLAMKYLSMASEQGQLEAQYVLGMTLLQQASQPGGDVQTQVQQQQWAVHWLNQAASQGEPRAMYQVGSLYSNGMGGMPADPAKAAEWVSASANAGYVEAQAQMGIMLLSGVGVQKNPEWAAYWFQKAAEQGSPDAQYNLALMYEAGDGGLEESKDQAIFWLEKAAAQGDGESQKILRELTR
eukprot:TRINITY_DN46503_c0_g1_i1.p1 TRINITY_DN46503_c0_g1~~TRINITY_DN46503_c0_g1_i1.p1  ORF type:complete len:342 (-),score=71.78 TRINITY_DN46503_c0_g1_i1:118-1143(-)